MNIEIDLDLKNVAEFMQKNISADKLVGVAHVLSLIAPVIWGHHGSKNISGLRLVPEPPTLTQNIRPTAT